MSASNNSLEEETLELEINRENGSRHLVSPGSPMHIASPNDAVFNFETSESSVSDEIYEPYTDNPTEISASAPLLLVSDANQILRRKLADWIGRYASMVTNLMAISSDVVSFAISLLSIYLARRPATKNLSYGYHRAEILGALISVFIIWGLTGYLVMEAIERLKNPHEIDGKTMCLIAAIGVGVNVVAAMLHVLGDLLSSIGVLISAIVIMVSPDKVWVDPICTFAFSALVIATTFGVLRAGIRILMEGTPSHIDCQAVRQDLENIEGVKNIHDLHIWELTVGRASLTAHIRLHQYDPDIHSSPPSPAKILQQARYLLKKKYNLSHVTIQIDG
ncbi:8332_t:CDS:2 [Paraglomus brasilianum]|uniref:8332_t:CDS:1 n=1 Tax=Paraglomus brasilianum TaxID=144538 RepID=A0A9N8VGQ4_9GLOM|nr:8332_t:CDS:2 [Paraglomus brasilianum]